MSHAGMDHDGFRVHTDDKILIRSCVAVCPPVPPVKPTNAVFPPSVAWLHATDGVVNVALVTVSVMVIVSVVPSYVMCTWKMSPLCRFTPPPSVTAGLVGDTPLVYSPVE